MQFSFDKSMWSILIIRTKYFAPDDIRRIFWRILSFTCNFEGPILVHSLTEWRICHKKVWEESNYVRDEDCTKWQRKILPFLLENHRTYSMQMRLAYFSSVFQIKHWLLNTKNATGNSTENRALHWCLVWTFNYIIIILYLET